MHAALPRAASQHADEAKRVFASLDNPPKGYLRYPELGTFLKSALPQLKGNDKRAIFTWVCGCVCCFCA